MMYRMKGIPVEAVQFHSKERPWPKGVKEITRVTPDGDFTTYIIMSPDGPSTVRENDWVVTNKQGVQTVYPNTQFTAEFEAVG